MAWIELLNASDDLDWLLRLIGDPLNIRHLVGSALAGGPTYDYPDKIKFYINEDPWMNELPLVEWDHENGWTLFTNA